MLRLIFTFCLFVCALSLECPSRFEKADSEIPFLYDSYYFEVEKKLDASTQEKDVSKMLASAFIIKDSKNNKKSTILKLPGQYKTNIHYSDDYDYKQQFCLKYSYLESNVSYINSTCSVSDLESDKSTIFHHDIDKTLSTSSEVGFFFNQEYPAIKTENDTHKSYETCILFNNKSIMYNVKVNYGQVFWFFSKQYQIKSVIIDATLPDGQKRSFTFYIKNYQELTHVTLGNPKNIVCEGRKDVPNFQLPHLNNEKLHLLVTEQFQNNVKSPIVAEIFFNFANNLSRYNVNYKTDYVVNGNKNQVFKLLEDKCEIIKENEFNELLFSGDKILSLESMIELFSFDNYKYGGSNEYRTTYKTPVQKFANHFFIHKYLSSSGDLVINKLTVVQNKTSGKITLSKIDHVRMNTKYETLIDTTLDLEEVDTNVNVEDFDVSRCYVNKPMNFYVIQFGELTHNNLTFLSENFQIFKKLLTSKLSKHIDVEHLKINKDISYYRYNKQLFVTFSILCTSFTELENSHLDKFFVESLNRQLTKGTFFIEITNKITTLVLKAKNESLITSDAFFNMKNPSLTTPVVIERKNHSSTTPVMIERKSHSSTTPTITPVVIELKNHSLTTPVITESKNYSSTIPVVIVVFVTLLVVVVTLTLAFVFIKYFYNMRFNYQIR